VPIYIYEYFEAYCMRWCRDGVKLITSCLKALDITIIMDKTTYRALDVPHDCCRLISELIVFT